MSDLDLDTDEVLNPELAHYDIGFQEGLKESARTQFLEGKEYGYQTGFQRFIIIGYLKGLLRYWQKSIDNYDSKSLSTHLEQLQKLLDSVTYENNEEDVDNYEKVVTKARNKSRIIANITKDSDKIVKLDDLVQTIGGNLQVSENLDEMW